MKILAVVSALDLKYRYGCTPAWWQLFKGLYEEGTEVVVTPYQGVALESLWWRTYPNPCYWEGEAFWRLKNASKKKAKKAPNKKSANDGANSEELTPQEKKTLFLVRNWITKKWIKHVNSILEREKDFDAVVVFTVPANHFNGFPDAVGKAHNIPVIYYDGDVPASLPSFGGFESGFRIYQGSEPAAFDGFICNSEGGAEVLKEMGAKNVLPLMWGADPELYHPLESQYKHDVLFYGFGSEYRKNWMEDMMFEASKELVNTRFALGGRGFDDMDTGKVNMVGDIPFSVFRNACCSAKINLNITRDSHSSVFASSSARPFELAAMGCCVVSNPVNGLERWFEVGKEMLVVNNKQEALDTYRRLLKDDKLRQEIQTAARKRILEEHTYRHRARQLMKYLGEF